MKLVLKQLIVAICLLQKEGAKSEKKATKPKLCITYTQPYNNTKNTTVAIAEYVVTEAVKTKSQILKNMA